MNEDTRLLLRFLASVFGTIVLGLWAGVYLYLWIVEHNNWTSLVDTPENVKLWFFNNGDALVSLIRALTVSALVFGGIWFYTVFSGAQKTRVLLGLGLLLVAVSITISMTFMVPLNAELASESLTSAVLSEKLDSWLLWHAIRTFCILPAFLLSCIGLLIKN